MPITSRRPPPRPFAQWADEWLAKKKVEKVKRRIVAVRDPKTVEVLELRVGYVKARFGSCAGRTSSVPTFRFHAFI